MIPRQARISRRKSVNNLLGFTDLLHPDPNNSPSVAKMVHDYSAKSFFGRVFLYKKDLKLKSACRKFFVAAISARLQIFRQTFPDLHKVIVTSRNHHSYSQVI
jgi:hypothetical protein